MYLLGGFRTNGRKIPTYRLTGWNPPARARGSRIEKTNSLKTKFAVADECVEVWDVAVEGTYHDEGNLFQGPTCKNDNPEEHGQGSSHSNNVHLD